MGKFLTEHLDGQIEELRAENKRLREQLAAAIKELDEARKLANHGLIVIKDLTCDTFQM